MLYCPEDRQEAVTEALTELGLQRWPFVLDGEGVQVMEAVPWSRQQVPYHVPIVLERNRIGTG